MAKKQDNKKNNLQTTGHSWDGIEEYNTPAPRWWLVVFLITIIWSIIYYIFFPSWPSKSGNLKGLSNWTSKNKLESEQKEIEQIKNQYLVEFQKLSFKEILNRPEILEFALQGGKSAFKDNCAACHGTGAAGFKGFPNLNDDDWLWGGTLEDIYTTLIYGIRSGHEKARYSQMPAFGRDEILNSKQISDVVSYVRSLSKLENNNDNGQKIYAENCAVCHGDNAIGNKSLGAPNLTDYIWLYGSSREDITKTIYYSRNGVMPYFSERLDDDTIRKLTLYVHSLGGGE